MRPNATTRLRKTREVRCPASQNDSSGVPQLEFLGEKSFSA